MSTVDINIKYTKSLILVDILPPQEVKTRSPLNLVVVADTSGSMQGNKIVYLRNAIIELISQLNDNDRLTLISYDDDCKTIFTNRIPTENTNQLIDQVNSLLANNSTNIYSALNESYGYFSSSYRSDAVNQIFLLSDGQPTIGKIHEESLLLKYHKKLVDSQIENNQNIYLTTYGIGDDYNGYFMRQLASQGHGNFYYINQGENTVNCIKDGIRVATGITSNKNVISFEFTPSSLRTNLSSPKLKLHSPHGFKLEGNKVNIGPLYDQPICLLFEMTNHQAFTTGMPLGIIKYVGEHNEKQIKLITTDRDDTELAHYQKIIQLVTETEASIMTGHQERLEQILDELEKLEKHPELKKLIEKYYEIINSYLAMIKQNPQLGRLSSSNAAAVDDLRTTNSKTYSVTSTLTSLKKCTSAPSSNSKKGSILTMSSAPVKSNK